MFFTTEMLDNFQVNSGVTDNYMKKMANFIRTATGRKSIPVRYTQHLSENWNILEIKIQVP